MNIIEELIDVNPFSRPGGKLRGVQGLVVHWTASPGQTSRDVRAYYQGRASGNDGYGSAHCGIDPDGSVHCWIPEDEIAYAVGSSKIDPVSGKVYTDLARQLFGDYAFPNTSPNWVTLSVEWMTLDDQGAFTPEEYAAAVDLYAGWCSTYGLDPLTRIITHQQIVGWKSCHKWFVDHPSDLIKFKNDVKDVMGGY